MASNHEEMMVFLHHLNKAHNGHFDDKCLVCQMLAKPLRRENYDAQDNKRSRSKRTYASTNNIFTQATVRHYNNLTLFKYDDVADNSRIVSRSQLGVAFLTRESYSLSFIKYMTGLSMPTIENFITKLKRNHIFANGYYPDDGFYNNNAFYRHTLQYIRENYKKQKFNFHDLLKDNVLTDVEINLLIQNNYDFYRTLNQTRINHSEDLNDISPTILLQLKNNIQHQVPMNNSMAQLNLNTSIVKRFYNQHDFVELNSAIMYNVYNNLFIFDKNKNKYMLKNKNNDTKIGFLAMLLNVYLLKINNKTAFNNYFALELGTSANRHKIMSLLNHSINEIMDMIYKESEQLIINYPEMFNNDFHHHLNNHNMISYAFNLNNDILTIE